MVSGGILGEILVIVQEAHYQMSYLKMLAMILIMKQMLIHLRQSQNCLSKVRGMIPSHTVRVINKLVSKETCEKSMKRFRILQASQCMSSNTVKEYLDTHPVNTQRRFNVDVCWNNVATPVNVIFTLTQRRFFNVDLSIKFTVETTLILSWL